MISIIVPVYKVEAYLRQCTDSILNQTYKDFEILLIDDGSPDRCDEICDEYAGRDPRIRVFHTENKGVSAARNLGLREARGEYIGFVDSDDWIEPDMFEILLHRIEETGTNISACGIWKEHRNAKQENGIGSHVYYGAEAVATLTDNLYNVAWNKLFRKDCWANVLFPEDHAYEDIATIYKVFLNAYSVSTVSKSLYHYRLREGSIVHTQSMDYFMDYWTALHDRYVFLSALPDFKRNRMVMGGLNKQIAFASFLSWKRFYYLPREERDYAFLHRVSSFARETFPLFGEKNWSLPLRAGVFFTGHINEGSLFVLYMLMKLYHIIPKKKTNREKTLFPFASSFSNGEMAH